MQLLLERPAAISAFVNKQDRCYPNFRSTTCHVINSSLNVFLHNSIYFNVLSIKKWSWTHLCSCCFSKSSIFHISGSSSLLSKEVAVLQRPKNLKLSEKRLFKSTFFGTKCADTLGHFKIDVVKCKPSLWIYGDLCEVHADNCLWYILWDIFKLVL